MSTVYVIRHAEKARGDFYNPRLRHQDEPISGKGKLDSQKLCRFFSDKPISRICVSGYQRTGQTIEALAGLLRLVPLVDDRLNEVDNGSTDGLTDAELREKFPHIWKAYLERKADFRFPDGETGAEAQGRIIAILEQVQQLPDPGGVILVSHEGIMRLLMCHLMQLPVYKRWNFQVDPCGIMEITYQPHVQEWKLIRFNQICL